MKSFFEYTGYILRIFNKITVLHKRHSRTRDIRLLKYVAADLIRRDLPRDTDYRNAVGIGGRDRRNKVSRARSRRCDTYGGFISNAGISVCGMSRVCLVADKHVMYIAFIKLIVKGTNGSSGIAEDDLDTFLLYAFDHSRGGFDPFSHPDHSKHNRYTYNYSKFCG